MFKGQLTYVSTRNVEKKDGKGTFKTIKLADSRTFTTCELFLDCTVPAEITTGTIVDVTINIESVGYRLYCTVTDIKKVA